MIFQSMRNSCLSAAVVILIAATGCSKTSETNLDDEVVDTKAMIERGFIKLERVGEGTTGLGLSLPGRIEFESQALASVDTSISARIAALHVRPGERVSRGALLVTLSGAEAASTRSAVVAARARLAAAEDLLRRQTEMVKRGVGTEVERFGAEAAAREARAEVASAERASALIGTGSGDTFTLRSPVGGTVLTIYGNVGEIADVGGDPIMEIGDPSRLWVVADAAEAEVSAITRGMAAEISVAGTTISATVDGIGSRVDSEQRRVPVYLRLAEKPANLTAGMFADVRLASDAAITVPVDAVLVKDGAKRIVYVRDAQGKLMPREVKIGASRGGRIIITQGVRAGEMIVTHGALLLDSSASQQL